MNEIEARVFQLLDRFGGIQNLTLAFRHASFSAACWLGINAPA
jgi:hypothetical protein